MWKSKLLANRAVRASALSTATTVTSAPSAATPFSDNSKASIAAVSELADCLDFMFDRVDYEEEPGDLLHLHLERLSEEAARYQNSRLADHEGENWDCPHDMAQLLYAACQCSCLVYDPLAQPGPDLIPVMSRAPSVTGTTKAVSMWKLEARNTLIVSIRGTASAADHMVNMNAEPEDASKVLGLPFRTNAHRGFLSCAKALLPYLTEEITRQLTADHELSHIIFTGHSAGGSVSSLLFLYFAYNCLSKLSFLKISLTTFGSAPVTSTDITALAGKQPNVGWMLAFVNEFDMVPRADQPYIRSIVDLYRTRYGLPCRSTGVSCGGPALSESHEPPGETRVVDAALWWTLPEPSYQLVGDVILSRKAMRATSLTGDYASDFTVPRPSSLLFMSVSHDAFHNLVFCEVGVHKRRAYLERMRFLATGSMSAASILSGSETLYTMGSRAATGESGTGEKT